MFVLENIEHLCESSDFRQKNIENTGNVNQSHRDVCPLVHNCQLRFRRCMCVYNIMTISISFSVEPASSFLVVGVNRITL